MNGRAHILVVTIDSHCLDLLCAGFLAQCLQHRYFFVEPADLFSAVSVFFGHQIASLRLDTRRNRGDFCPLVVGNVGQLRRSTGYVMIAGQLTISGREACREAPLRFHSMTRLVGYVLLSRVPCVHVQDCSGLKSLVSYDVDPFLQAPFSGLTSKRDVESKKNSRWSPLILPRL